MITTKMTSNRSTDISPIHFQEITQMTFVVELIPEESIRSLLADIRFNNVHVTPGHTQWAVDHERNAQIVLTGKIGGSYDGTQETRYYSLYWKGEQIRLSANPIGKTYPSEGQVEMNWKICDLAIPHGLLDHQDEIVSLIKDAFQAVGYTFNGDRFTSVNVQFADDAAK